MQIQNKKVIRHINDGTKFSSDDFDKSDEEQITIESFVKREVYLHNFFSKHKVWVIYHSNRKITTKICTTLFNFFSNTLQYSKTFAQNRSFRVYKCLIGFTQLSNM